MPRDLLTGNTFAAAAQVPDADAGAPAPYRPDPRGSASSRSAPRVASVERPERAGAAADTVVLDP